MTLVDLFTGWIAIALVAVIAWACLRKRDAASRNTYDAARQQDVDQQIEKTLYPRSRGPHGFDSQHGRRPTPILRAVTGGVDRDTSSPPHRKARGG